METNSNDKTTATAVTATTTIPKPKKRKRLNFACNYCRERKTRCGERKPSCHSCLVAGVKCITTDKRRPGADVERRTAGSPRQSPVVFVDESTDLEDGLGGGGYLPYSQPGRSKSRRLSSALSKYSTDTDHLTPVSATAADANAGTESIDPPAEDASGRYGGLLPLLPRLRGSNTLDMFTGWLDLAFYRLGIPRQIGANSDAESGKEKAAPIALSLAPPSLPRPDVCHTALQSYFSTINKTFPILEFQRIQGLIESAIKSGPPVVSHLGDVVSILQVQLVIVLGSIGGEAGLDPDLATQYDNYCQTMLGHVLSVRSLEAVQCALMLAIALRQRDQISSSWHVTTLCISMAQSMGIHRRRTPSRKDPSPVDEESEEKKRRTWWSIFSFEKLFAFEFGRPSFIRDADCNQMEPTFPPNPQSAWSFRILTSFARLLSQINEAGIRCRIREERSSQRNIEGIIRDKIRLTGETVHLLMQWADSVPERLRPRSDLICSRDEFPLASFISMHYNNALMLLSRNSFLISNEAIRIAVERYAAGQPWSSVIQNGQTAAANSARTVIKLLIDGHELGTTPALSTLATPLHAVYVLAVHLLTHPGSRLAHSDLNLMHNAVDFAEQLYERHHTDRKLQRVLKSLTDQISAAVQAGQSKSDFSRSSAAYSNEMTTVNSKFPSREMPVFSSPQVTRMPPLESAPAVNSVAMETTEMPTGSMGDASFRDVVWPGGAVDDITWDWDDFSQVFDLSFGEAQIANDT
ncbi:oleate-activated transcription factor 1 [Apiospora aurea]|uniref:Oleate-activated transcription factor 1 n=1 Tax=Apiospora aurea TaxID=335848 RepID=A0ABR1Q2K6_9PEZI